MPAHKNVEKTTQTKAILRNAKLSAQKARLVTRLISKKPVEKALHDLSFSPKKAARIVKKVLESAIANASHNNGLDIDTLFISNIYVDEGMRLKRTMPRAKGRANRITKPYCHITVVVGSR